MPHLRLEYSGNIKLGSVCFKTLFSQLHEALVKRADADLSRCQSRAICCENFYVGDGRENRAFVHLQVVLLEGRTSNQLQETGNQLLEILKDQLKDVMIPYNVQISVHLNEIASDRSYKFNHYAK